MTSLDELRDRLLAENPYRAGTPLEDVARTIAWEQGVVAYHAALPAWLREQLLSDEALLTMDSAGGEGTVGPPRGEICPECGMTRWEGKQLDDWIKDSAARVAAAEAFDAVALTPQEAEAATMDALIASIGGDLSGTKARALLDALAAAGIVLARKTTP